MTLEEWNNLEIGDVIETTDEWSTTRKIIAEVTKIEKGFVAAQIHIIYNTISLPDDRLLRTERISGIEYSYQLYRIKDRIKEKKCKPIIVPRILQLLED